MLTLQDLFNRVMIDSGQFIIPDERIELIPDRFKILVDRVLGMYNGYNPIDRKEFISILHSRKFTFTDTMYPEGIPEAIADVIPVRVLGSLPYGFFLNKSLNSYLEQRGMVPWTYRKPSLTVPFSADFEVRLVWHHKLVRVSEDPVTWGLATISDRENEFFDLLCGKFMQALGRSRRAFTLNDLPITSDASDLVSEGKDKEEKAMQDLIDNKMKWYLAW